MQQSISSDTDRGTKAHEQSFRKSGSIVVLGSGVIIAVLLVASVVLFLNLPDANVFNDRVERIFVENDALTTSENVKLLEILAQSGTTFSDVLQGYRVVIFILLVLSLALLLTALYFLMTNHGLNLRVKEIERSGIYIRSLTVNREEQAVYINNMEFGLTEAALETLAMLCEARLDDEVITGVDLEAMITGKARDNCDEAAGATRIKRLRDHLGNQIISQLLVRNISRKGYILSIDKDVIRMI